MYQKIKNRLRSNRAGSGIISVLTFTFILVALTISLIDWSMYSTARDSVTTASALGARDVAIMGGAGTGAQATVIEKKYGETRAEACSFGRYEGGMGNRFAKMIKPGSNAIECGVIYKLSQSPINTVSFDSPGDGVKCSPAIAGKVGQTVSCSVQYTYTGVPGSAIGFLHTKNQTSAGLAMTVYVTSVDSSETGLTAADLVNR